MLQLHTRQVSMMKFLKDETGATAIEDALIAALIAVAIIGGLGALSGSITNLFTGTESDMEAVFTP